MLFNNSDEYASYLTGENVMFMTIPTTSVFQYDTDENTVDFLCKGIYEMEVTVRSDSFKGNKKCLNNGMVKKKKGLDMKARFLDNYDSL